MLAAKFGVGWLAEMETEDGFDTNEVSRDTNFDVVPLCGSDVVVVVVALTVGIVTA